MTSYPPFSIHVYQPREMSRAEHDAECKRIIEDAWRQVGVQIHVTIEGGCIRSDLKDGWPRR